MYDSSIVSRREKRRGYVKIQSKMVEARREANKIFLIHLEKRNYDRKKIKELKDETNQFQGDKQEN